MHPNSNDHSLKLGKEAFGNDYQDKADVQCEVNSFILLELFHT